MSEIANNKYTDKTKKINLYLLSIIAFLLLIRLIMGLITQITADESYYLLWAKHLDLSYYDHPGMVAWINFIFLKIFKEPLISARIAAFTTFLITLFFIYKTIILIVNDKFIALSGVLFYLLIPYNFILAIGMAVEQPLIMFSSIAIYHFVKLLITQKNKYIIITSIFLALGFLSKYTVVLLIFSMILILLLNKKYRKLLISKHFIISLLIFIVIISPFIYWNIKHNFASIKFHLERINKGLTFKYLSEFLGVQIISLSPIALLCLLYLLTFKYKEWKQSSIIKSLLIISLVVFLTFLYLSLKTRVWGHWTAVMYIPLAIAITILIEKHIGKINYLMGLFTLVVVIYIGFVNPGMVKKIPTYRTNYKIKEIIQNIKSKNNNKTNVYANSHGAVGILSYYCGCEVYYPRGIFDMPNKWGAKQFSMWEQPTIKKGDNVIYYFYKTEKNLQKFKELFERVEIIDFKITLIEGHIAKNTFVVGYNAKKDFIF